MSDQAPPPGGPPPAPLAGVPNRAARVARRLGRGGHRHSPLTRLIIIAAVIIAWIFLSIWGEVAHRGGSGISSLAADAAYRPFTFLTANADYADGSAIPPQWIAARFLGGLLPVIGLFWVLRRWLAVSLSRAIVRYAASGHVVILGRDGAANALAVATSRAGDCVVLIDASLAEDAAERDRLGEEGVVVLPVQATPPELRRARIAHASQTVCWAPRDSQSLEDALVLHGLQLRPGSEIALKMSSHETRPILHGTAELMQTDARRLRPIAPEAAALRERLGTSGLVADAAAAAQARVCVALHGGGPMLLAIGELVLRHNWLMHLGPPQLLVVTPFGGKAPAFERLADLLAGQASVFEAGMAPSLRFLPAADLDPAAVSRHLIDCGDDEATLAYAFALAASVRQQSGRVCRVQPVLRESELLGDYLSAHRTEFEPPIYLARRHPLGQLLERSEDETAARLHLAYQAANGGEPIAAINWRTLPETIVRANRAAADHATIKRWDAERARGQGSSESAMLQAMAAAEHRRWCTERLLDGWLPGPRDNQRRLHDKLIPWNDLSVDDQRKDVDQVLLALALPDVRRS